MRFLSVLSAIAIILVATNSGMAEQVIQKIDTRPGVSVKILLNTPETASKGTLLFFPGSHGDRHFSEQNGHIKLGANFLVRTSAMFVQKGFTVVIIDVPSDHSDGMSDGFRKSPEHAQDVKRIIGYLKAKNRAPLYLVGTSRGTISVAYLATVLKDDSIKGYVLSSTMGNAYIGDLPMNDVILPVLIVHHANDGCHVTPFGEAHDLKERMKGSSKVDFIEVHGGASPDDSLVLSGKHSRQVNPCKAISHHGYIGIEEKVVNAITDWLSGKPVTAIVGE